MLTLLLLAACGGVPETPPEDVTTSATESPTVAVDGWAHYGAAFTLSEPMTAAALLDDPASHVGQTVLVEGRVADVCQKAGCWMVLTDNTRNMRVLMGDHAFAVDKSGTGADCRVEGVIEEKVIDPETVAHLESESKNTGAMPEKSATDGKVFQLVATGVSMRKPAAN